jgi:plastocyanin
MHVRGLLAFAACAALVLIPGAAPAPAQAVKLVGTVGPGFSISLEFADGRAVTQIDPGTYEITVRDLSEDHNFHLYGPGVEESTQVETTGTVTWTVSFREGRYTIQCDPHLTQMVRVITVGNPPPVPVPKPPPTTTTPKKLLATVGPKSSISLRSASGAVLHHGVKAGTYSVVVRDRTKLHNFHLVGTGVNRRSTVAGVGTTTWKLKLAKGVLRFYSDKAPKTVKGSVTVR